MPTRRPFSLFMNKSVCNLLDLLISHQENDQFMDLMGSISMPTRRPFSLFMNKSVCNLLDLLISHQENDQFMDLMGSFKYHATHSQI